MATAEMAACLPVLVLFLAVMLSAVSVGEARVRVADAAAEAARAGARGDLAAARALSTAAAPGSRLSLSVGADTTRAVVQANVRLLVPWLPAVSVTERAVAATEPGADDER